jgi:uncharacterized repeat protein (TIGR03843 family)
MTASVDFSEAERMLLEADFADCRPLWYSSNYVYLAQMCGPDSRVFAAVYKPRRGESPLWDFPDGTLYRREVAAYRLSQLLGWPMVPPTVIREGPEGIGALQLFIKHDQSSHFFEQRRDPALIPQLQRMAVFDYVANNADRKGGHCLIDDAGRIWGIDHGLCFHYQYKMRTVIWDWAEEPVPEEWLAAVEAAGMAVSGGAGAAAPVLELLAADEVTAMLRRIDTLLADRRFPKPGPHRSHPWPLV